VIAERNERRQKEQWQKNGWQKNGARKNAAVKDRRGRAARWRSNRVRSAPVLGRIDPTTDVTPVSIMQIRRPNVYRLWAAKNGRARARALEEAIAAVSAARRSGIPATSAMVKPRTFACGCAALSAVET